MSGNPNLKKYSRIALIIFYLLAGANHFINPSFYGNVAKNGW